MHVTCKDDDFKWKSMEYDAITPGDDCTKAVDFLNLVPFLAKHDYRATRGWMRGEEKSTSLFSGPYTHGAPPLGAVHYASVRELRRLRPGGARGLLKAPAMLFDRCLTGCVPTMNAGGRNGKVFSAVDTLFHPCFATGTR